MEEKREKLFFFLFVGIVYIILMSYSKNRNWNVGWVVKWNSKIDKVSFENVK